MKRIGLAIALGVALALTGTVALAARNSSGTMTLPAGNPFVPGTAISSSVMNNTMTDLANELTNSLDRTGRGGMLAPMRGPDGSVTAPTLSWTNETNSGLYRISASDLGLSVGGTKRVEWTSTGEVLTGTQSISGNTSIGGTLAVTGTATLTGATTLTGGLGGNLPANAYSITGLATPVNSGDAATKGYVDGAVVGAGVGAPVMSASSGTFTTTSTGGFVSVTNLSATITTHGSPVMVMGIPADATSGSTINNSATSGAGTSVILQRDGTSVARWYAVAPAGVTIQYVDVPAAGSHTYSVLVEVNGSGTVYVTAVKLAAIEL